MTKGSKPTTVTSQTIFWSSNLIEAAQGAVSLAILASVGAICLQLGSAQIRRRRR